MTTAIKDLWPSEFGYEDLTPPVTILRQQATILGQKTRNLVEGDVVTSSSSAGYFAHTLYLVAPAMDGYRHCLFTVSHEVAFYPLHVVKCGASTTVLCSNEAEYLEALQTVFAEEQTRKVVSALIAQSKA